MSVPGGGGADVIEVGEIHDIPLGLSIWFFALGAFMVMSGNDLRLGLGWFMVVSLSILVHELGHALVAQRYGLQPRIVLHGLGGYCQFESPRSREDHMRITAAGPGAGLALGMVSAMGWWFMPETAPEGLQILAWQMTYVNLFWSMFNLLPILPMDGGRLHELFWKGRISQGAATLRAHRAGVVFAAALVVLALTQGRIFIALMVAWFGYSSVQFLQMAKAPAEDWSRAGAHPSALQQRWRDVDGSQVAVAMMGLAFVGELLAATPTLVGLASAYSESALLGAGEVYGLAARAVGSNVLLAGASAGLVGLGAWRFVWQMVDNPYARAALLVFGGHFLMAIGVGFRGAAGIGALPATMEAVPVMLLPLVLAASYLSRAIGPLVCKLLVAMMAPLIASWLPKVDGRGVAVFTLLMLGGAAVLVL